jgi:hypothetical protein
MESEPVAVSPLDVVIEFQRELEERLLEKVLRNLP